MSAIGLSNSIAIDITGRFPRSGATSIFSNATLALSLRDLGLGATNAIRVRRDGGSPATQDFTFSEISDGTLVSWVGAGNNGFVTTMYDQAGTNNAIQTTSTLQPIIVDTGVLVTRNGLPSVYLPVSGTRFFNLTSTYTINTNLFVMQTSSNGFLISSNTTTVRQRKGVKKIQLTSNNYDFSGGITEKLSLYEINDQQNYIKLDNVQSDNTIPFSGETINKIGTRFDGAHFSDKWFSELVNFPLGENTAAVANDMLIYYSI